MFSMQASQKHMVSGESGTLYSHSYSWTRTRGNDPSSCSDEGSQGSNQCAVLNSDQYCTLESSSSGTAPNQSSSTLSFSPNGSPASQQDSQTYTYPSDRHQSPENNNRGGSPALESFTADAFRFMLRQLETEMLGSSEPETLDAGYGSDLWGVGGQTVPEPEKWTQVMRLICDGDLKELLVGCARAVEEGDPVTMEWLMPELEKRVSVSGEPLQRLGAYMLEGLVARQARTGASIYRALRCKEPSSPELFSYMNLLYEICPYFKFAHLSANGAIAEAMRDEERVHIVDFQISQGGQWFSLIQAMSARPGGPPRVRITGIDDSVSAYARGGGLEIVGRRLAGLAASCGVPFEFNVAVAPSGLDVGTAAAELGVLPGEALAVNFALMLHHMPDESVGAGTENRRDQLLRVVRGLGPAVVTLVEQEANSNTTPFLPRFAETMNYYGAIFESIDMALPREDRNRIGVEQHCLARDIVNIIACEEAERVERHELLGKWRSRFAMAGFAACPLSATVNSTIRGLLESYSDWYRLEERGGALYLGWKDRAILASCAFRPAAAS